MEEDITGPGRQHGAEEPVPLPPAASIFTAVQDQLGLKLVSERRQLEFSSSQKCDSRP